jgi:hypothetical protein
MSNLSNAVPIFGGTMTGLLILSGDPVTALGACTKQYADALIAGLEFKNAVIAASTGALTVTYLNGVGGVGATLTNAGVQAAFSIDGQSPVVGNRVLIKDQASTLQNGIYTVTNVGSGVTNWILTRATDYDQPSEIHPGDLVPVESGTANSDTLWLQIATVATVGVDAITFAQFSNAPITLPVSGANGGTGVANTGKTITIGGNVTMSGGFTFAGTITGNTSVTFPVSGTLATTTQVITVVDQNSNSATLANNTKYVCDNGAGLITFTLPTAAVVGDTFIIVGGSSGGWTIAQNANQIIHVGSLPSTTGVAGSVASSNRYDCITLTCVVTNLEWSAYGIQGNLTVV